MYHLANVKLDSTEHVICGVTLDCERSLLGSKTEQVGVREARKQFGQAVNDGGT
jgi:hypothetical protein